MPSNTTSTTLHSLRQSINTTLNNTSAQASDSTSYAPAMIVVILVLAVLLYYIHREVTRPTRRAFAQDPELDFTQQPADDTTPPATAGFDAPEPQQHPRQNDEHPPGPSNEDYYRLGPP